MRGLARAHKEFGSMPFPELIAPAIELAEKGFPVDGDTHSAMERAAHYLQEDPEARRRHAEFARVFLKDGMPYGVGEILRQLRADEVGARCQELAELDVAGPQPRQGSGNARLLGLSGMEGCCKDADGRGEGQRQFDLWRRTRAFGHEAHTVLGEHEARAGKPQAIDQRSGH